VPAAGEHYLDPKALAGKSADYLREEIVERVAGAPMAMASVGRDQESLSAELEMDRTVSTLESHLALEAGARPVAV
jgi:hypothetical protein